ncbi:molecular chaperone HtpG [Sulfurospirillum arcachonense]|uniref:molecular chaperone HtpG n=1 Tax=Sulfurospirillum arcachonense TaxID=57666 RepID=UPI0004691CBE|nr:molecular chaperone HtpG [Sulfurospirillum arcachonense]
MSKHQFQTEVTQLLDLMIHSLYSNKEIFLRELISNSSDALDKLNYLTLTDDNYKNLEYKPKIDIAIDKGAKTLTLSDSGIGMNEEDLVENLGTIARSGTKSFVQNLSGDEKKDSSLIGQFGVGFYSAFMVANKIEVTSKKAGEDKAYTWSSEAGGDYEIVEATKDTHGTSIKLFLKDEEVEFLEYYRIESIIKKYSNHIPFGIWMDKEETIPAVTDDDGKETEPSKTEIKNIQVNKASALWRMNKSEIKKDEYKDFYKQISHDSTDPILWTHTKAEGTIEYNTLFYIPTTAPMDLFRMDYQPGVKLYVKRVFITDDEKELLPVYLRFVKGIIDAEDLPLNVSREILQQNIVLETIKKASVKKILSELKKLQTKDKEKYLEFYKTFGRVLKEGLYGDFENKEALLDLAMFKSSKREGLITLKEYKEAMKDEQKSIYYITGEEEAILRHSPLIEQFKAKDIEVLLLDEDVDSIIMPMVTEYDKTPIKPVNNSDIDEEIKEDKEEVKENEDKYQAILVKMKEILKDDAKDVKISSRLSDSPSVLIYDKNDPDFQMQQMLKQMGQDNLPTVKPILEINPKHEIFEKLLNKSDDLLLNDVSYLLMDQARLSEGMKIEDITGFAKRLNKIIAKAL